MFYVSAAYLVLGMVSIYNGADLIWAGPLYVLFLSMPFWFPPLGRSMNLDVDWDIRMFDWFKGKNDTDTTNVVPFPELKEVPKVEPPAPKEEPAKIFYRIGCTDQNRVAFSMGYSEITMNKKGCQQMIDQLTVFMNQIEDDDGLDSN